MGGHPVKTSKFLTESELVIHSPHPWVEYEPKDEWWLLKYGMAHRETVPSPQAYLIEDTGHQFLNPGARKRYTWLMHPWTALQVYNELQRRNKER